MKVTIEWEQPQLNLAERILLMGIDQSRAMQQQRLGDALQLGEDMVEEMNRIVGYGTNPPYEHPLRPPE